MEPSIYLSEEGNRLRSKSPFKENKIKDLHNFASYKNASEMIQEEVLNILKDEPYMLKFINNPTEDMILTAIKSDTSSLYYVKEVSDSLFNRILEHDKQYTEYVDKALKCVFPYHIVHFNNLSLEHVKKIVKETYTFHGIKINILDREFILEILKEGRWSNVKFLIEQRDTFSKEDFKYLIDNLINHKLEKRFFSKKHILSRGFHSSELQCYEICKFAMDIDWINYKDVKIKSKEIYLECLKYNNKYAKDLLSMGVTVEELLSINGSALKYIENPTIEQIKLALSQDGNAINFVKDKTEELCLIAVNQNGLAIKYIKTPSLSVSVTATLNHPKAIMLLDQSLRPEVREEIKNQTFKLNNTTVTRKDVLVRLEIIKKVNSKIYNLYKECFEKEISYTPLEMVNLCLKELIKKYEVSENVLKAIIKNQLDIIAYVDEVKKPFKEKIKPKKPLEDRLHDIFTYCNGQKVIGIIKGNKITIKGETLEYELPSKVSFHYRDIKLGDGSRALKRGRDGFLVEYGEDDVNIIFKEIE